MALAQQEAETDGGAHEGRGQAARLTASPHMEEDMDKQEIKGKVDKAKGWVKEKAGKITDNSKLESEGKADQIKGEARETYGKAKRKAGEIVEKAGKEIKK